MLRRRNGQGQDGEEREALMASLEAARRGLDAARSAFEHTCEPELVDSFVYEMGALEARIDYLLRRLRELEATAPLRFRPALRGRDLRSEGGGR